MTVTVIEGEGAETPAEPAAVEAAAVAAVEIAAIEADARVEIAEIAAETERAAIEARHDEERTQWQTRIATLEQEGSSLREQNLSLMTRVEELETLLTPPPSPEPMETAVLESPQSPPDEADGPRESGAAVSPETEAEPAPEPKPKRKAVRWI